MNPEFTDNLHSDCYQVGVATAAFIFFEGKFLIHLRSGALGQDTWGPPGGKLDFGESPEDGLIREVKEETDLDIHDIAPIGFTNDLFLEKNKHYVTLWFAAKSITNASVIVEPSKCLDQRWVSLDEMPSNTFFPTANILKDPKAVKILKEYSK